MNNMFLEGPIQTGKSTLIRKVLAEFFGPSLDGVGGFTCQRITFPTRNDSGNRTGFRLMPAPAPIAAHTCVVAADEDLISSDGVFKLVGFGKPKLNLNVFETEGVELMNDALARAKAGDVRIVLLDEIGGHEMMCPEFRKMLFRLLDSDIPCTGVVKLEESARMMVSRMPGPEAREILRYNRMLHEKITGVAGESGETLYYERGVSDEHRGSAVEEKLRQFIAGI